ncbi:hypothetical protein D3C73_849310 [compost metagenome]
MRQDDNREVQIGSGERQERLAFRGRHDARQQVELALFGLFEHNRPTDRFDGRQFDGQSLANQVDIVCRKALVTPLIVAKLKGRPGRIDTQAQVRVGRKPATFFVG